MKPTPQTEGFALILSLLFTGIVLLIVASTAASLATGTRRGGANERQAYQALLIAESGLNSLPRRAGEYVRTVPYTGTTNAALVTWLAGLQTYLGTTSPATGDTVTLAAYPSPNSTTFTTISTGTIGASVKVTLQDFVITARTLPPGTRPRSAITSLPPINGNGSATVSTAGANGGTVTTVSSYNSTTGTVTVADASALRAGDYVKINSLAFKVTAISGNALTVARVPAAALPATLSGNVDVMLSAVAASYAAVTPSMDIKLSNASDYVVGEKITIGTGTATITALNLSTKVATVTWNSAQPSTLPEGTQVFRDVTALRSAGTITPKANKLDAYTGTIGGVTTNDCPTATTCRGQTDPLLTPTGTAAGFTQMLFGVSDQELNDLVPLTTGTFPAMTGGIMRIRGADFDTALKNTTSTGVLIVDGDITSSLNGSTAFNGFIYVRGGALKFSNGNFTINGGLAIQGGTASNTDITGNLKVNYNAVNLRSTIQTAGGSKQLDTIAGSWRQR